MEQLRPTVTIEKVVHGGWGLAHHEGQTLLVRGALAGETVGVAVLRAHKGVQEATVVEVLTGSPHRLVPPCPAYEFCGGCQLQHASEAAQLTMKHEMVKETLQRMGRLTDVEVPQVIGSSVPFGYRNSLRGVVVSDKGTLTIGLHREGKAQTVEATACLLPDEGLHAVVVALQARLATIGRLPVRVESLEIRRTHTDASTMVLYRTEATSRVDAQQVFALAKDIPMVVGQLVTGLRGGPWGHGQDALLAQVGGLTCRVHARSVMPANWQMTELLADMVLRWVQPTPGLRVLNMWAGIGVLGLLVARAGALVTLVESNPSAMADARWSAEHNHIGRCRFRHTTAEALLETAKPGEYDVLVLDPPRSGLSPAALNGLVALAAPRIVYVSGDPPTLARDLRRLADAGYRVTRVQPFDLSPQTAQIDVLVELVR
jgi:23S rRNA (uracil1939-C5)-methyltransferase